MKHRLYDVMSMLIMYNDGHKHYLYGWDGAKDEKQLTEHMAVRDCPMEWFSLLLPLSGDFLICTSRSSHGSVHIKNTAVARNFFLKEHKEVLDC